MRTVSGKVVDKIKTQILCSKYFLKSWVLLQNVEKYGTARQAKKWQHNTVHALCMLDKYGNTHTHTHTHIQNIRIFTFPWQNFLRERALMLRYTYVFLSHFCPERFCVLYKCNLRHHFVILFIYPPQESSIRQRRGVLFSTSDGKTFVPFLPQILQHHGIIPHGEDSCTEMTLSRW